MCLLLKELNAIHQEHGADLIRERHSLVLVRLEERARDVVSDSGRFSIGSDNYTGSYTRVKGNRAGNGKVEP